MENKVKKILEIIDYGKLQAQLNRDSILIKEYEWIQSSIKHVLENNLK